MIQLITPWAEMGIVDKQGSGSVLYSGGQIGDLCPRQVAYISGNK